MTPVDFLWLQRTSRRILTHDGRRRHLGKLARRGAAFARVLLLLATMGVVCGTLQAAAAQPPAAPQGTKVGKDAPKKKLEIPGIAVARPNGTWLGLTVVGGVFRLGFYDAKKAPMAPDVDRAVARWHAKTKRFQDMSILAKGADGAALVGNQFVRPPLLFKVYLSLLGEDDKVIESYVVDFHD